jgi:ATP-dependent DNA ligase
MLPHEASDGVLLSEHIDDADGVKVYEHACRMGLEGIVAKRSGRTTDWLKIRNPSAPAVTRLLEE